MSDAQKPTPTQTLLLEGLDILREVEGRPGVPPFAGGLVMLLTQGGDMITLHTPGSEDALPVPMTRENLTDLLGVLQNSERARTGFITSGLIRKHKEAVDGWIRELTTLLGDGKDG